MLVRYVPTCLYVSTLCAHVLICFVCVDNFRTYFGYIPPHCALYACVYICFMYVNVHVCIMYMYVNIHVCIMYIYKRMYIYIYIYIHMYTYVMYVNVHVCM